MSIYIAKADGIARKIILDSADGANVQVHLDNVQPNAGIDEQLFTYTPPEGVEVGDMSQMPGMMEAWMQAAGEAVEQTPEPPAPEPRGRRGRGVR